MFVNLSRIFGTLLVVTTLVCASVDTVDSAEQVASEKNWRDLSFDYRSEDPGSDSLQDFSALRFAGVASLTAGAFGVAYLFVFQ